MAWMSFMQGALGQVQANMNEKKALDYQDKQEKKEEERWKNRNMFQEQLIAAREAAKEKANLLKPKTFVTDPETGLVQGINSNGEKVGNPFEDPEARVKYATEKESKASLDSFREQQLASANRKDEQYVRESNARIDNMGKETTPRPASDSQLNSQVDRLYRDIKKENLPDKDSFEKPSPEMELRVKLVNAIYSNPDLTPEQKLAKLRIARTGG